MALGPMTFAHKKCLCSGHLDNKRRVEERPPVGWTQGPAPTLKTAKKEEGKEPQLQGSFLTSSDLNSAYIHILIGVHDQASTFPLTPEPNIQYLMSYASYIFLYEPKYALHAGP